MTAPHIELEASGLIFPGNFSLDEIRKILPKIKDSVFRDMSKKWNRFEKNRILNAISDEEIIEIKKILQPDLHCYSFFAEKDYKSFMLKLKLMETTGEISIRDELSESESSQINIETKDIYGKLYPPEMFHEKIKEKLSMRIKINPSYTELFKNAPELKNPEPKPFLDFLKELGSFHRRYGLLAIEPYLHHIPDLFIRETVKKEINGGSVEDRMNIMSHLKQKRFSDLEHLLNYCFTLMTQLFDSPSDLKVQLNDKACCPKSTSSTTQQKTVVTNHDENLTIWKKRLNEYRFQYQTPSRDFYEILEAIFHYNLHELIPDLQSFYHKNTKYKYMLKNFLENLGHFEGIKKSKMIFPGNFSLDEIKLIMTYLEDDSISSFSIRWNYQEKNQILNAVENPESTFKLIQPYAPSCSNFKNARSNLKDVILSLEKAGKIEIKRKMESKGELKDFYNAFMKKSPPQKPFQSNLPSEIHVNRFIDAARALPSTTMLEPGVFQDFIKNIFAIMQKNGALAIEEYLPWMKDKFLRTVLQGYIDGIDSDIIKMFIQTHKEKLINEFQHIHNYLAQGLSFCLEGRNTRLLDTLFSVYFPEIELEEQD